MLTRRKIATSTVGIASMLALAACGTTSSVGTAVPTLAQVQAYVGVLNSELPLFVQESISTGLVKPANQSQVLQATADFQALANQFLSPTFNVSNAQSTLASIGMLLTTVASFVPVTAPYVGLIQLAVMLITAFMTVTPVVVPPVPTSVKLAAMHKDTIHLK